MHKTQFENTSDCESSFTDIQDLNKNIISSYCQSTHCQKIRLHILNILLTEGGVLRTASLKAMEALSLDSDKISKPKQQGQYCQGWEKVFCQYSTLNCFQLNGKYIL